MVKKTQLALTLGSLITGILILFSSCKKINESTALGGDLIPPVDNISTFDTIITIEAYNDLFTLGGLDSLKEDSTYSHYTYEQFLGLIDADPLFGKTDAQLFFELKPDIFPFTFIDRPDSLTLDSVVLILDYLETYGDTTATQTVTVSEITSDFRADTSYLIRKNSDFTIGGVLGSRTFTPASLDDSVKAYQDTTNNQLRIKLSNSFGDRLLDYDTTGPINAYLSDSLFETNFKGFAVKSTSGNAIMGFDVTGANTKLAIYYKYKNNGVDTVAAPAYFWFKPYDTYLTAGSGSHNYIKRDYSGSPVASAQGGTSPDPFVYIQNTPGTFARIKTPALAGLSNRVVHRAELIAEQVYHASDTVFPAPPFMYLDVFTSSLSKASNIPYDVVFDGVNQAYNLSSFGVAPVNALDGSGRVIKVWHFNITRYVQHIVNGTQPVHDLRLFSPLYTDDQYIVPVAGSSPLAGAPTVFINPNPAKGRVRLAGNTGPLDPNPRKMRIRIVYSKI